jgi:uncharacterized protein (TIGR00661 family)
MTQAISLSQILREAGHEVVHVVVGKSPQRKIPDFFLKNINSEVTLLESPNFATDKDHKKVKPFKTLIVTSLRAGRYIKSIRSLAGIVKQTKPDVIINFYDFLGGLYYFFYKPKAKLICIAHQYLLAHPEFTFPENRKLDKLTLLLGNKITTLNAEKVLALSFQYFKDVPGKKLFVVPPLLRSEIKKLQPTNEEHILVYMVNPGYGKEVEEFHQRLPTQKLEVFWDQKDKPETWKVDETLTYHQLNDKKFLEKMASSKGYITTAGFESVCEAMYLGKPVMMIPVEGHYEQACNAVDAEKAGAGIPHNQFEIQKLVDYIPSYTNVESWFRPWADSNKDHFIKHLT